MGAPKRQFSRPAINLGGGPKKDWIDTEVQNLEVGDTVRGWGTIDQISTDTDVEMTVVLWQNGRISNFYPEDVVTAFTAI